MSLLILRTHTTAIPRMSKKPSDPSQPRVMALSAMLFNKKRQPKGSIDALIRPEGWISSAGAAAKHEISQRDCELYGRRAHAVMADVFDMIRCAQEIAVYGYDFAAHMIEIELDRLGSTKNDTWKRSGLKRTCIMTAAANLANAGTSMKFEIAYERIVERPLPPSDDLLGQVRSIARLHYAIQDRSF